MSSFSDRLNLILKQEKIKASELSEMTGLSQSLISQYLSGKFEAKNDKISIISKALHVNELWLMGLINESASTNNKLESNISKNIRYLRKSKKLSQLQLGDLVERTESTIQMWESDLRSPTMDMVQQISIIFDIDINSLVNNDLSICLNESTKNTINVHNNFNNDLIQLPVYAPLCCGEGMFVDEEIIDYVVVPSDWINKRKEYFCQFASGDSMINAGIKDADILIFEKASVVDSGTIGCFCVDENIATCKKFMVNEESDIYLMPANENHMPIKIDHMNEHFRTVGKLAFVVSDRRAK